MPELRHLRTFLAVAQELSFTRACGAQVQIAVPQVIGGGGPPVLTGDHFALRPVGCPVDEDIAVELAAPAFEVPLRVHWVPGSTPPGVDRLREHLAA